MPMDQSYFLWRTEECHLSTTGWQSPLDPTDKQTIDKGQGVAPAQALELVSGSSMHERPPEKRGTCLNNVKQRGRRQGNNLIVVFLIKNQFILKHLLLILNNKIMCYHTLLI